MMECCSAIEGNVLLIHSVSCMNFRSITPSERSQTYKTVLYDSIYMAFQSRQNYGDRNRLSGCWGWELMAKGTRELLGVMEIFCISIVVAVI